MIYARISIYQALKYPWKQSGMPELAVFKIVKKVHFVNLSFSLSGLTRDFLDHSPWFEYKSTPFWSAHVCGTPVLCYHDSDLIMGVYSAFCEWGMADSPFCHIMRMLIMHVLPWWSHVTSQWCRAARNRINRRARACAREQSGQEAQDHENLLFSEQILKASKFIAGSSKYPTLLSLYVIATIRVNGKIMSDGVYWWITLKKEHKQV